jgi:hypothetical protein
MEQRLRKKKESCSHEGCNITWLCGVKFCETYQISFEDYQKEGLFCRKHVHLTSAWKKVWGNSTVKQIREELGLSAKAIKKEAESSQEFKKAKEEKVLSLATKKAFIEIVGESDFNLAILVDYVKEEFGREYFNNKSNKQELYALWYIANPMERLPKTEKEVAELLKVKSYIIEDIWPQSEEVGIKIKRQRLNKYAKCEGIFLDQMFQSAISGDKKDREASVKWLEQTRLEVNNSVNKEETGIPRDFLEQAKSFKISNRRYDSDSEQMEELDKKTSEGIN